MTAAKHALWHLEGTINYNITLMFSGLEGFKIRLSGITAWSTTEAELVTVALAIRQAVYSAKAMDEMAFGETFKCVPPHMGYTPALHVARSQHLS